MAEDEVLIPVLEASIRAEEESRLVYAAFARKATRDETRQLAERLSKDEASHRDLLLSQFAGQVDKSRALAGLDAEAFTAQLLEGEATPSELLRKAIDKERDSESHYKFLAERYAKTPHWVLFLQLSEGERGHKNALQRELDALRGGAVPW